MKIKKQLSLLQTTRLIIKSHYDLEKTLKLYMILNIQKHIKNFKVVNFNQKFENDIVFLEIEIINLTS